MRGGGVIINLPSVSPTRNGETPLGVRRLLDMTPSPAGHQSACDVRIDETASSLRAVLSEAQRVRRRTNSQDPGEQIRRELKQQWGRSPRTDTESIEEIRRINSKKVEDLRRELEQLHSQVESEEAASQLTENLQIQNDVKVEHTVSDLKQQVAVKTEELETQRRTYEDTIHSLTIQNAKLSSDLGTRTETIQDLTKKLKHASEERDYLLIQMDRKTVQKKPSTPPPHSTQQLLPEDDVFSLREQVLNLEKQLSEAFSQSQPAPPSTPGNSLLISRSCQTDSVSDHQPEVLLKKLQLAESNLAALEKQHSENPTQRPDQNDAVKQLKDQLAASERRCEQADAISQNAEETVALLEEQLSQLQNGTEITIRLLSEKLGISEHLVANLDSIKSLSEKVAISDPSCLPWMTSSLPVGSEKCISLISAINIMGSVGTERPSEIPTDIKMIIDLCQRGVPDTPIKGSVSVLTAKLSAAEEVISQLRNRLTDNVGAVVLHETTNTTMSSDLTNILVKEMRHRISQLESKKSTEPEITDSSVLQKQLQATQAKLTSVEELNSKLLTLNTEAGPAVAQADVSLLKSRLASNEKLVDQLSSIITSNKSPNSSVDPLEIVTKEKISALERVIIDLSTQLDGLQQDVSGSNDDVESKQTAINSLKDNVELAERKCQAALREVEHLETELQKAREQERELLGRVLSAESRSEQSDAIASDAENRLQDAVQSLQEAETELQSSRKAENESLGNAFDDIQRSNAALQSALSFREAELDASQAHTEELTAERDKLQALLAAATERAEDSIARLSNLETELDVQKKESDAARKASSLQEQNAALLSELSEAQKKLKSAENELSAEKKKHEAASANAKKTIRVCLYSFFFFLFFPSKFLHMKLSTNRK